VPLKVFLWAIWGDMAENEWPTLTRAGPTIPCKKTPPPSHVVVSDSRACSYCEILALSSALLPIYGGTNHNSSCFLTLF
jgi:hypothetical protein